MKSSTEAKDWFQQNVSRETFLALAAYEQNLLKWQKSINLVSNTTLADTWRRHFMDSWQLAQVLESQNVSRETILADLGSGAGFPGIILSMAGFQNINLVESDQRKSAFLRETVRQIWQNVSRETFDIISSHRPTIHNKRVEDLDLKADVITCRAFAKVAKIFEISENIRHPETQYFLLKPLDIDLELTNATKYWYFEHQIIPSVTDMRGCILILSKLHKK
jgi:16S rRNA (guanine527-N7)-methyltransferase